MIVGRGYFYYSVRTMMTLILLTIGILAVAMAGIGLGLFFGRAEVKGSCGGVGGGACGVCGNNPDSCENADPSSKKEPASLVS